MNPASIRTFFAIELPCEVQSNIMEMMEQLKLLAPRSIKWVSRENLHITLKFIESFNPVHFNLLYEKLQQELNHFQSFNISLDRCVFFPRLSNPRGIWIGIHHSEKINKLFQIIEKTTSLLGYPGEKRPFHAHITLGRIRYSATGSEIDSINNYMNQNNTQQIQSVIQGVAFFQSDLTKTGPIYKRLFIISLKGIDHHDRIFNRKEVNSDKHQLP